MRLKVTNTECDSSTGQPREKKRKTLSSGRAKDSDDSRTSIVEFRPSVTPKSAVPLHSEG